MASFLTQCQVKNCPNENFTYCPHCQLYVCINCINKHHKSYKPEYNQLLHKAFEQNQLNQKHLIDLKTHKEYIDEIFNQEIRHYLEFQLYLQNKQLQPLENIRVQDFQQLQNFIQQYEEVNQSFSLLNNQIRLLLNEFISKHNNITMKTPMMNSGSDQLPIVENNQTDIEVSNDDNPVETNFNVQEKPVERQLDTKNEQSDSNSIVFLTRALEHYRVNTCPLVTWSFGLSTEKHGVRDVPCTRLVGSSVSLMSHLRHSHCLNYRTSIQITRVIASGAQWYGVDLFSNFPNDIPLVNLSVKTYRAKCPLIQYGLYGLTENHQITLCSDNKEIINLFNHFKTKHNISSYWSTKLIRSIIKGQNKFLFPSNLSIKTNKKT